MTARHTWCGSSWAPPAVRIDSRRTRLQHAASVRLRRIEPWRLLRVHCAIRDSVPRVFQVRYPHMYQSTCRTAVQLRQAAAVPWIRDGELSGKNMARTELISTAVTAFVAGVLVLRATSGVGNGTMLAASSITPVVVMLLLWDTFRTDQPTVRVRAHARGDRLWT